ncbi:hypothetical protein HA466_0057510 [Hirschfeldia incana]|nr:hypothetical protein HA466_0057510 [Hirschfeldia incana]
MASALFSSSKATLPSSSSSSSWLFLLLTLLTISLACFAFLLQWPGGINEWFTDDHPFSGMAPVSKKRSDSGCVSLLGQSHATSFPYLKDLNLDHKKDLKPRICITTSTSAGLEQTLPWIFYHKVIGVSTFYLFVEGTAASPNVSRVLETIPDDGMDWILHLDTDELVHPSGASEYSLRSLFREVPEDVDAVIFVNHESSVERDDIKEPFTEVSMFKKNYQHVPRDVYFENYKDAAHGNTNYFLTYGNGKSAARIQDHLRPNGAHRWYNYKKIPKYICSLCPPHDLAHTHGFAFIIASTSTSEEMLQWYREHVVWTDEKIKLKLLKKGILTRIYAPMVIIQELREAGVFSSVVTSAHMSFSNKSSILTRESSSSQATVRKVLEFYDETDDLIGEYKAESVALPPQSPPSVYI